MKQKNLMQCIKSDKGVIHHMHINILID